jgi:hypothetical protein
MLIETASNPVYQEVLGHTQKRKEVWKAGTAPRCLTVAGFLAQFKEEG